MWCLRKKGLPGRMPAQTHHVCEANYLKTPMYNVQSHMIQVMVKLGRLFHSLLAQSQRQAADLLVGLCKGRVHGPFETADIGVHVVHTSHVIATYKLESLSSFT